MHAYLDGPQTNFIVFSEDASHTLNFTYQHTIHEIAISLGPKPFIPPQLISPLSLGVLAAVLSLILVKLVYKTRKHTHKYES